MKQKRTRRPKSRTGRRAVGPALRGIYALLWAAYGAQHWWPAETALEVVVGAILTQNTAWRNVERAIDRLRAAGCLDWRRLQELSGDELAELVRPAGTFRVKARRLKAFVDALFAEYGGSLDSMLGADRAGGAAAIEAVRKRLLAIHGVGPETADAILLYAGGHPSFVVDAYTKRILRRHFIAGREATYDEIRGLFHAAFEASTAESRPITALSAPQSTVRVFNEYHALLVRVAKEHCRATARCEGCPLAHLPHDTEDGHSPGRRAAPAATARPGSFTVRRSSRAR